MAARIVSFLLFFLAFGLPYSHGETWIKAGYWYAGSESPIPDIKSGLFTHLLCAFADINPTTYQLSISSSEEHYFSTFTDVVKRRNPSVVTLLSIWGGKGPTGLSILGERSRNSGKAPLILTMAVHYVPTLYSVSYHIEAIQRNLDWAHIPAYDYYLPSRVNFTHAHAALYDPLSNVSTDFGIREWISKGFPASKLVLGLPYHGYAWTLVNPNHNGIGAPASGIAMTADGSMSYKYIKWFLRSYGATSMYNATYVVNYVTIGTTWIGFDDVQAIRAKISYAKEKKLLGYNVFQVSNDDNWALSQAAQDDDKDHHKKQELLVKILVPIAVLILVAGSIMCCYSQSRVLKAIGNFSVENFNSNAPNLRVFSFAEIKEATNNFSFENKLGEGGFGPLSSMASKNIALLLFIAFHFRLSNSQTWVKAGYWYSGNESPVPDINSALFTHLLCAFAWLDPSAYQIYISPSDEQYFATFTNIVKKRNPSIITLLSIWAGKNDSTKFSSMISQPSYRKSFIESSIKTARLYGFQGLDLSGYWPRTVSNTINMGILFDEWRAAVNSESRDPSQSPLILTLEVHYLPTLGSVSYEVDSIRRNMDWVHVAAYDYYLPSRLPAGKLVLGLAYHGYAWTLLNPKENGIGAPASGLAMTPDGSVSYKYIKWFIRSYECASVYNATYVVNYCSFGATWIGYDDVEAIRTKVSYAKEKGLLGYNVWEVSHDENWVLSLAAQGEDQDEGNKQRLLVIILLPIAIVVLLVSSIMCHRWKGRLIFNIKVMMQTRPKSLPIKLGSNISSANSDDPNLQVFSFSTIKVATNNFSSENRLGEGGFGPVYKGKLPKGQEIAVKRLSKTSHQGLEEFKNEVTLTATLQHVNLVKLLGFCTQREEKMLIYECMPNKSLDFYLFDPEGQVLLDWGKRIHIIEGITQGLLYLQEYSRLRIIHRDLKASNILLDGEMKPKIADFGIARIFQKDENEANTGRIVGTYGYVSPEYVQKGTYSVKSDVYSFGVLLLQIISGKKNTCFYGLDQNLHLLEYAYELWKDGKSMEFMDPSLDDACSSCKLTRCMQVALLCVQENPADRPSVLEVDSMIKNETAAIATPRRPAFAAKRDEVEADGKSASGHEIGSVNVTTISQVLPR
ncbi:unnamed protein product, partial [Vitis vinifera]